MLRNPFHKEDEDLTEAIADGFKDLKAYDLDDDEATQIIENQVKLYALKNKGMSKDTVALIAGNVGIAILVLWFEKTDVVTTKLFPFLGKPK